MAIITICYGKILVSFHLPSYIERYEIVHITKQLNFVYYRNIDVHVIKQNRNIVGENKKKDLEIPL